MKKTFISILGTNDYLECRHSYDNIVTDIPVKYCQEDIIKLFCKHFDEASEIRFFLTADAERSNWLDNGHLDRKTNTPKPNKGLKRRLEELNLPCPVKSIPIKEGFSETDIWDIFQVIFDSFREEEEVFVDITHAFRSIPMLMITLLNFAKQVKNIKVIGIYYAAFEKLGKISDAEKIPPQERIAPILNLTSFSDLQDWTNATFDFINNANVSGFNKIIIEQNNRIQNIEGKKLSELESFYQTIKKLEKVSDSIALCRGLELIEYNYDELRQELNNKELLKTNLRPFYQLLEIVQRKIYKFKNDSVDNGLLAVEWCLNHRLYQQAITILEEFIITKITIEVGLDYRYRIDRELVNSTFAILNNKLAENEWNKPAKSNKVKIKMISSSELLNAIFYDYLKLIKLRNDINHCGFTENKPKKINEIKKSINKIFNKLIHLTKNSQLKTHN